MSEVEKTASHLAVNYVLPLVSGVPGVKTVVGFRDTGVKKGSIAAMAQSYQKDVKAGSTFSKMQSSATTSKTPSVTKETARAGPPVTRGQGQQVSKSFGQQLLSSSTHPKASKSAAGTSKMSSKSTAGNTKTSSSSGKTSRK